MLDENIQGKYRGLVRLCGVMRWAAAAGLLYAPRGDEEAGGGPRERHIAAEHTPRRNRPLVRLVYFKCGLRDVGVRVTALVQRAACECSDACRCCQLPANALCVASIYCCDGALAEYTEAPEEYALVRVCPLSMSIYKAAYEYRMHIGVSGIVVEGHLNNI